MNFRIDKEETGYRPISRLAREINRIVDSKITETIASEGIRLRFLIFGAAKGSRDFDTYRVPVRDMILSMNHIADFPEDIKDRELRKTRSYRRVIRNKPKYLHRRYLNNPETREHILMLEYDITIILLTGPGTISESSIFTADVNVAHKIRLYVPKNHSSKGFILSGPLIIWNNVFRFKHVFTSQKDLLDKIRKMVANYSFFRIRRSELLQNI